MSNKSVVSIFFWVSFHKLSFNHRRLNHGSYFTWSRMYCLYCVLFEQFKCTLAGYVVIVFQLKVYARSIVIPKYNYINVT